MIKDTPVSVGCLWGADNTLEQGVKSTKGHVGFGQHVLFN